MPESFDYYKPERKSQKPTTAKFVDKSTSDHIWRPSIKGWEDNHWADIRMNALIPALMGLGFETWIQVTIQILETDGSLDTLSTKTFQKHLARNRLEFFRIRSKVAEVIKDYYFFPLDDNMTPEIKSSLAKRSVDEITEYSGEAMAKHIRFLLDPDQFLTGHKGQHRWDASEFIEVALRIVRMIQILDSVGNEYPIAQAESIYRDIAILNNICKRKNWRTEIEFFLLSAGAIQGHANVILYHLQELKRKKAQYTWKTSYVGLPEKGAEFDESRGDYLVYRKLNKDGEVSSVFSQRTEEPDGFTPDDTRSRPPDD